MKKFVFKSIKNIKFSSYKDSTHLLIGNDDYTISNTLVICTGLFENGKKGDKYLHDLLDGINERYKRDGNVLAIIRGEEEDVETFEERGNYGYSNVVFIPDYSAVVVQNKTYLVIGGGVSRNRWWREIHNELIAKNNPEIPQKENYEREGVFFDEEKLTESLEQNKKIYGVISTSCPLTIKKEERYFWFDKDTTFREDHEKSRENLDKIATALLENGKKPIIWVYFEDGVFPPERKNGVYYYCLSGNGFSDIKEIIGQMRCKEEDVIGWTNDSFFSNFSR